MLFWICLALLILGIVMLILGCCDILPRFMWDCEIPMLYGGTVLSIIMGVITLIMVIDVISANTNIEGQLAAKQEEYKVLVHQVENDFYDNMTERGKAELMEDVMSWNAGVANGRIKQNDFWLGIFVEDIYHELELIDLGDYN